MSDLDKKTRINEKVIAIIDSCKTFDHFECAKKFLNSYRIYFNADEFFEEQMTRLVNLQQKKGCFIPKNDN